MNKLEALRDQILAQNPTDQQREAIFAEELEFLLRAAPGSGKTWTSCRRFIWRGANWPYPAGGLALLSFTNAAIREFQAATIKIGRRALLSDPNYVGTFDAFVERFILTPFGHLIVGSSKRPKLFIAPRPGDWNNKKLMAWTDFKGGRKAPVPAWEIIPFPDNGKIAFKASDAFGGKKLLPSGNDPVKELMKLGLYTHSQRVYWACRLLFNRPHIATLIAKRFPEIIVDEAQDTNVWLLIFLNFIRERGTRVTLVGDPDQCIYEFSMADATSLPALKEKWKIPEKPLSLSFRCNDQIAVAVRNIGGNQDFIGCVYGSDESHHPIIIRETKECSASCVTEFQKVLEQIGINEASSAIICRAHVQLEMIRGEVNYTSLRGITKELAQASFLRDCRKDYKRAFQIVIKVVRSIAEDSNLWERMDEFPESEETQQIKIAIWHFVKSQSGLPAANLSGSEWISRLRQSLGMLITEIGIKDAPNLNLKIKKTGIEDDQLKLPLFAAQTLFPSIRQETIHQVKGENIDAVLVLGSAKFWNSVVDSIIAEENSEDRRLAYVAMTRARHLLVVGLPASHFDKQSEKWTGWGFKIRHKIGGE
jgi:superfamily I DNA/RNA helicase